ncbi:MAG: DUF1553 domain-containing protein, partial [Planctomycetaceae bacterium]|nr:DUF1553 domain-containing protein [Planctomycetaceae bacterium]
ARPEFRPEQLQFFRDRIQPILAAKCVKCHGEEEKVESNFFLTSRAAVLRGGELGPAVDLANPAESSLLKAVRYDELQMPPNGKIAPSDVAALEQWVRDGLPWPAELEREPSAAQRHHKPTGVTAEDRQFWAYQPVVEPRVPEVQDSAWVRTPVDAFILRKLEERGLAPTSPASARSLIRRATYDLTGLPPTPEDVAAFEESCQGTGSEAAYEALIDRLLASPHYGEKWGRHWLDLVRYAESHGYERDSAKPFAWRYRDYVIESLNRDKPYDQFLREQLAGDLFPEVTPESLTATGYYRLGTWDDEPADRELAKYDILDGIVSTTSSVVLGMSVGCARCHDHKKDPILQRDYYKLLDCFRDLTDMNRENLRRVATPAERAAYDEAKAGKVRNENAWQNELTAIEAKFVAAAPSYGIDIAAVDTGDLSELSYRLYRDSWKSLPEFDTLKAETTGKIPGTRLTLAVASRAEAFGLVLEGKLRVPQDGAYTFIANMREGFDLRIDGKSVLRKPAAGVHEATTTLLLKAGLRTIRIDFFNEANVPKLQLAWSGPGFSRRLLTDNAQPGEMIEGGTTWAYRTQKPDRNWAEPSFDDTNWRRGPAGFGTRGTPGAEVGTEWRGKDIWLRRTFRVATLPETFAVDMHHDEDVEIYLNGRRVFERSGHTVKYERFDLGQEAAKHLKVGENLLAVHCRQTGGGQYIDVRPVDAAESISDLVKKHGARVLGPEAADRYSLLSNQLDTSRKSPVAEPGIDVMAVGVRKPLPTHVLLRGLPQAEGDLVTAGVPEVVSPIGFQLAGAVVGSKDRQVAGYRAALAEWLTADANPLTARVMVNRLWQYHFGKGLVGSSNDFGKLGELPTHPELLDWLAVDFVRGGWKLKRMHKLLMLSSTYRMSSAATEQGLARDPGNMLVWRANTRRLAAEEVRDSILAASGAIDLRLGGPSVYPPIPKEVLAGQSRPGEGWPTSVKPEDANRRSVYVHVKRSLQLPILAMHDQADTDGSCAVRYTTTVPTQSLGMLNGDFIHEQARALAERLGREQPNDTAAQIRRAVQLTAQRNPSADEVDGDIKFLTAVQAADGLTPQAALELYCLLMLNTNEFFYVD